MEQPWDHLTRRLLDLPSGRVRERFGRALLPAVNALSNLAAVQAQRGLFEEAVRHGRAAIALAEEVGRPYSVAVACWNAGRVHTLRGDLAQARPPLSRARSLAEELTIGFLIPAVSLELSALAILEGRAKDALSLVPAARAAIRNGLEWWEALAELRLGEALFAAGRVDEARVSAMGALGLARERGEQGHEAWALRLQGEIAADPRVPATDEAEGHYREALTLAERLDMRPLAAHCLLGLGKLNRGGGDAATAKGHLTTAGDHVPRDGHDLLVGEGGGGAGAASSKLTLNRPSQPDSRPEWPKSGGRSEKLTVYYVAIAKKIESK